MRITAAALSAAIALAAGSASAATTVTGPDVIGVSLSLPSPGYQQTYRYSGGSNIASAVVDLTYQYSLLIAANGGEDGSASHKICTFSVDCDFVFGPTFGDASYTHPTANVRWADRTIAIRIRNVSPQALTGFYGHIDFFAGFGGVQGDPVDYDSNNWTFTFNDPTAIPEPATWLLIVVGFGLGGAMVRSVPSALRQQYQRTRPGDGRR